KPRMRNNRNNLLLPPPQPPPRRLPAPRQPLLRKLIQPRLRGEHRVDRAPIERRTLLRHGLGVRARVARLRGVLLELGEGERGAAFGDAPAERVGGGLEGAPHGARDDEVDG
ncbi:hypothetical protein V498_08712, partial [Pseudogymnoascus sp. VKM F-4517 (FW-2822)]